MGVMFFYDGLWKWVVFFHDGFWGWVMEKHDKNFKVFIIAKARGVRVGWDALLTNAVIRRVVTYLCNR